MPRSLLVALLGASLLGCAADTTAPVAPTAGATAVQTTAIRSVGKHKGDYLPAHNFKLEIDGVISGGFKEISGLESEIEVIEFKDGDDAITHKRAGKAKYKNITLQRGFVADPSLMAWYKKVLAGTTDRRSVKIIMDRDTGRSAIALFECWPVRYSAHRATYSQRDANGNVVEVPVDVDIVEELEFAVEKVERARFGHADDDGDGLPGAEASQTRHDTAKNAIGNIR